LDWLADRVLLFTVGDLVFVTFGLFAGLGAAFGLAWTGTILIGQGLPPEAFPLFALGGCVAMVGGSWLVGLLYDVRLLLEKPAEALWRPVFVSWGGLVTFPIGVVLFSSLSGFSALLLLDALTRSVPLGHAVGRLGCLSYGCCFGRRTGGRLAITYRNPHAKAVRVAGLQDVPLHPAALYEAVLGVGVFIAVNVTAASGAAPGVTTGVGFILYGLGRFGVEFLRDNGGPVLGTPLSLSQLFALTMAAIGGFGLLPLLAEPATTPPISWTAVLEGGPWLLAAVVPGALLVFVSFALHRRRVGVW
jgi:phosphatidylglycerol:prolipoprotein diacylglycerol transferase